MRKKAARRPPKIPRRPPEDPGLPVAFLEALERAWGMRRASGVLIGGLAGEPFFYGRLRAALEVRFGLTGANLDEAEALVRRKVAPDLAPPPRDPSRWVFGWQDEVVPDYRPYS